MTQQFRGQWRIQSRDTKYEMKRQEKSEFSLSFVTASINAKKLTEVTSNLKSLISLICFEQKQKCSNERTSGKTSIVYRTPSTPWIMCGVEEVLEVRPRVRGMGTLG
uniref:Uncharacterized protein n=1 Tax=Setaria digitata TaxID=48799 RepID=A0A915PID4_9BILA